MFIRLSQSSYFRQNGCTTKDSQQKYNSRCARTYREKLEMSAKAAVSKYSNALFPDQEPTGEQQTEESKSSKLGFFEEHEAFTKKSDAVIDSDTDSDLVAEEEGQESGEEQPKGEAEDELNNDEDEPIIEKKFEPFIEKKIEPLFEESAEPYGNQKFEPFGVKKIEPLIEKQYERPAAEKFDFMNDDEEEEKSSQTSIEKKPEAVNLIAKPAEVNVIQKIAAEPKVTTEFLSTKTEYKPVITSNRKPLGAKKVFSLFHFTVARQRVIHDLNPNRPLSSPLFIKPFKQLGAKKGGLGAQKVNKDFSKIEEQARKAENQFSGADDGSLEPEKPLTKEEELENLKDLEQNIEQMGENLRKTEEQWRVKDKSKADQLERLGMGVGMATGSINKKKTKNISHSAVSSIKGFDKVETGKSDSMVGKNLDSIRDLADNLVILDIDNDAFFEIKSLNKSVKEDSDFWDSFENDKLVAKKLKPKILDAIEQLEPNNKHSRSTAADRSLANESLDRDFNLDRESRNKFNAGGGANKSYQEERTSRFNKHDSSNNRRGNQRNENSSSSVDINKKFAGAKSISSAQLFGKDRDEFESNDSVNRFQGKQSVQKLVLAIGVVNRIEN